MKKIVFLFAAMFAVTTAMAQEDCCKNKAEKAQTEKKCGGDCANCEKHQKAEGRIHDMEPDRTKMMTEQLGLDKKQAAQVKELNDKYADVFQGGHHGMHPSPHMKDKKVEVDAETGATPQVEKPKMERKQDMEKMRPDREEMKKMAEERRVKMDEYEAALKEILTEEQFNKYQENKKSERPQTMRRMPKPAAVKN